MSIIIKKIVFVIHSLQAGGMERVVTEFANHFVGKKNIEIHIVLYGIKRDIFYKLNNKIHIHKPHFTFDNKRRLLSTIKTVLFLRKKINKLVPDTVVSFGEYWNNLVLMAVYGLKTPIYIADRSSPLKNLGSIQNSLRKWLYPKAAGLILQTQEAKAIYQNQFKKLNISVIGNPIREIDNINNIKRENIVLMVGRLIDSKHQDRLIKIFSKINKSDWKLVLVGGDAKKQKNKEKLTKLINGLKIENRIILAGSQKNVESYYLKSKIFVFTSSSEGFPNVIGEAMAAGLPVVAYDCVSGPSEIINNKEDGFLVPLYDDKMFQEKLEMLMKNEELRKIMGKRAVINIKRFDNEKISNEFLKTVLNKQQNIN